MKKRISKIELMGTIDIAKAAFLQMGYNPDDKARIQALAESLVTTWKKEFTRWDINVLRLKIMDICISGELDRLAANTLIPALRQKYKAQFPKSTVKEESDIDYQAREREFFTTVSAMLFDENRFKRNFIWQQVSLFHLAIEKCRDLISPVLHDQFLRLRNHLTTGKKTPQNIAKASPKLFGVKPDKTVVSEEHEIIDIANMILDELTSCKEEVRNRLLSSTPNISPP